MQTGSSETLIGWNLEKPLMSGTDWRERDYVHIVGPTSEPEWLIKKNPGPG